MKEEQLKNKLFLMQMLDWVLFLSVVAFGVYAYFFAEVKPLMALLTLLGMAAVHFVGNYIFEKVAVLRVQLHIFRRDRGGYRSRLVKRA